MPAVNMYVQYPTFLKMRVIEFLKYAVLCNDDVYAQSCTLPPLNVFAFQYYVHVLLCILYYLRV